jgi:TusA-related sulfurtransferase/predicted peroxiredoxin
MTSHERAQVDVRGTWKPYRGIYEVIKALRDQETTSVLELIMNYDKGILKDIRTWCEATGNELLSSERQGEKEMRCLIQKGEPKTNNRRMTVIISTANLDYVVYPLDKALAGVVLGMDINIVFEGAGVRLLKRGCRSKLSGVVGGVFTSIVERVMKNKIGWPLPQESILILEDLGAHFYVCGPSMFGYGVREEEFIVENYTIGAVITWVDLLACTDIHVFSKAQFERP